MKTRISAKRVIRTLCGEYNEYSMACGYYRAVGDKESEKECQTGRKAMEDVLRCLFEYGDDYREIEAEAKCSDVKFTYSKMEMVE